MSEAETPIITGRVLKAAAKAANKDIRKPKYKTMSKAAEEIQKILDRNFMRGDNAKALKELNILFESKEKPCESCGSTLPKGMKHLCYNCYDDMYFPK